MSNGIIKIGVIIGVAEGIAILISFIPYILLLWSINDNLDPERLIEFAEWLQWFLYGQVVGWPVSLVGAALRNIRRP